MRMGESYSVSLDCEIGMEVGQGLEFSGSDNKLGEFTVSTATGGCGDPTSIQSHVITMGTAGDSSDWLIIISAENSLYTS